MDEKEIQKKYYEEIKKIPKSDSKICILIAGMPGSGKSYNQKKLLEYLKYDESNFVEINIDLVLEQYYNFDFKYLNNAINIMYNNFLYAIENNRNIIVSGTGINFNRVKDFYLKNTHSAGYKNIIIILEVNKKVGLKRTQDRYKKEVSKHKKGRVVNIPFVYKSFRDLKTAIPRYKDLKSSIVDRILVFDANNELKKTDDISDKK